MKYRKASQTLWLFDMHEKESLSLLIAWYGQERGSFTLWNEKKQFSGEQTLVASCVRWPIVCGKCWQHAQHKKHDVSQQVGYIFFLSRFWFFSSSCLTFFFSFFFYGTCCCQWILTSYMCMWCNFIWFLFFPARVWRHGCRFFFFLRLFDKCSLLFSSAIFATL